MLDSKYIGSALTVSVSFPLETLKMMEQNFDIVFYIKNVREGKRVFPGRLAKRKQFGLLGFIPFFERQKHFICNENCSFSGLTRL